MTALQCLSIILLAMNVLIIGAVIKNRKGHLNDTEVIALTAVAFVQVCISTLTSLMVVMA